MLFGCNEAGLNGFLGMRGLEGAVQGLRMLKRTPLGVRLSNLNRFGNLADSSIYR